MKNGTKKITLFIAAALILVLALGMLVACTDGQTPSSVGPSGETETGGNATGPQNGGAPNGTGGGFVPGHVGDTDLGAEDVAITSDEYFDKFRSLANTFGTTPIEKGADIYFHSEMSGMFGLKKEDGSSDEHFELGFEIEAILDRTSTDAQGEYTSQNSAIRARMFSGKTDILAAAFFVNDPLSLYIDFAGSHIKLSCAFVYEDNTLNELLGRAIGKALNKEFDFDFGKLNFNFSLNKLLDAIVEGTGSDWSPTVLLKSLAKLIGLSGDDRVDDPSDDGGSSILGTLFSDTFNATKSGNDYSIILDTRDTNELVHAIFSGLLGVDLLFKMDFSEDNGRLRDGVRFELGLPGLLNAEEQYPYVGMRINLLEMLPVAGKSIGMPAPLDDYKGDIAFKTEECYSPSGFTLFGSELRELRYSEAFRLDLMDPIETNKTAVQIRLSMVNETLGEDVLFDLSFVGGRLAIRVAPQVIFKEGTLIGDACRAALEFVLAKLDATSPALADKIADALYVGGADGSREEINENFGGVAVDGISVKEIFDGFVTDAVDAFKAFGEMPAPQLPDPQVPSEGEQSGEWHMPDLSELSKFSPANIMRQRVLPALGRIMDLIRELDDGKLTVHTDSVLDLLLNISNDLAGLDGDDRLTQSELFDNAIEGACKVLDMLAEKGLIVYDETSPDALTLMDNCFKSLFEAFTLKDAPQKLESESYTKYALRLLLGSTSFDLSLDLTDGWRYSIGFGIAGATFSYKHSFTTWEGLDVKDLYDSSQNGWLLLDFTDLSSLFA